MEENFLHENGTLDQPGDYVPCLITEQRVIGTAMELGVTNVITSGVAPNREIKLPPNSLFVQL